MMTYMSDRLLIRPVHLKDAPAMYDYAKDPRVGPMAGWNPHASLDETKAVIKQMMKVSETSSGVYAVCLHDNVLLGTIDIHNIKPGFQGEMGLVLHPDYHGQGIMSEAGRLCSFMLLKHSGLSAWNIAILKITLRLNASGKNLCSAMKAFSVMGIACPITA